MGDIKNLSYDDLKKITNNFSDPTGRVGRALLFRGFIDDGQEVTVKTWDFMFPAVYRCVSYPRDFHVINGFFCGGKAICNHDMNSSQSNAPNIIPLGTTSDFARTFGWKNDPHDAIERIL
ncbi:hypothetical protein T459_12608 [Capsicum annuum]|uniref:DAGKc domain-containing protein n=1 Tax=Capsicum annuum TaxID=4072 RepID=A0A2G2ZQD8_CAPAN|nr:hypothetical protein T459_12608 [Capsicum annuum]